MGPSLVPGKFLTSFLLLIKLPSIIGDCSAGSSLQLTFLSSSSEAKCADGSQPGYYISEFEEDILAGIDANRSFVIWLGDTQTCAGEACFDLCEGSEKASSSGGGGICEGIPEDFSSTSDISDEAARCLASRATCTSDWWDTFEELNSETILCSDDDEFGEFKRIFVPSCSLDYWLGNENASTLPEDSFSEFLFRGNTIFKAVIDDLIDKENITFAEKIVLGGTRGGGIGALHQASFLRQQLLDHIDTSLPNSSLSVPTIYTIADSSWIVPLEKFAPSDDERTDESTLFTLNAAYQVNSSEWIERAQLLETCQSKFPVLERYKCLFPSEIVKFHFNDITNTGILEGIPNKALFIQSQYNLIQLEDLGIIELDAVNEFEDDAAFAQGALNYIENFGQQVRSSIETVSRFISDGTVFFFSPACGQHQYIVPTRIHAIENGEVSVGDLGDISVEIDEVAWENIHAGTLTARELIILFTRNSTDELNQIFRDSCGEFLCNEECITEITPFSIVPLVSTCVQQLVLVYAFLLIFVLVFFFFLSYLQVQNWRTVCRRFWNMTRTIEQKQPKNLPQDRKFQVLDRKLNDLELSPEEEEFEFLLSLAVQRNQSADEVQEQLMIETNADSEYRRVHLMVENLSYWAPAKGLSLQQTLLGAVVRNRIPPGRQIIRNVSSSFEPGKVHALMGPSGSGKTTLLELISLSKQSGRMSGSRYINGVSANARVGAFMKTWLLHNQSYVSQQDYFFPSLTVREHLEHCAWLIMPEYMPDERKLNRVWQLIRLLDLTQCADTLCGDGGINYEGGISGGQRRRLSVATQLLSNPCALFLDEPTSGLDSVSALNLVRRLQKFARKAGMNVIMTIHQPRREIYGELDRLYILVKGCLIFAGSVENTAQFFHLDLNNERLNVGNELLDILRDMNNHDDPRIKNFQTMFEGSEEFASILDEIKNEKTLLSTELASQLREVLVLNSLAEGRYSWQSPSSVFWLQWVLLSRTIKRGGVNIMVTACLALIAGLVLGGLFFDTDSYNSKTGLAYLCVSTLTFLQGVFLARRYFDEKNMFDFEKRSGTMRSWQAFLFAQFSRDALTSTIESLFFGLPAYFMAGFSLDADRVLVFIVLSMLIGYATTSQNVLIQIDRDHVRSAATLQIGLLALGALFNGFIVNLDDLPLYYSWIPYLMLNFYGFVGILINELHEFSLPCDLSTLECASRTGDVVIRTFSYDHLDVFICALALILLILFTRSLGVFDFYYRYGRSSRLTKIGPDGISKPVRKKVEAGDHIGGITLTKVLAAQETSAIFKKPIKEGEEEPDVANGNKEGTTQLQQLQTDNVPLEKTEPKHIVEGDMIYDDEEDFSDAGDEDEKDGEVPAWISLLISRYALAGFFAFDLATAGYVCLYNDNNTALLVSISSVYLLVYAGQFFLQLGYLIPFTLENSHRDFVWAVELDGVSLLLLIIDICLVFLQFGVSDSLGIRQLMTLTIRLVRLFRVQLFFYKGSKAHRIRAESFLRAKNTIINEYIDQLNDNAVFEGKIKPTQESNWVKTFRNSTSFQDTNLRMFKSPVARGGNFPRRPERPRSLFAVGNTRSRASTGHKSLSSKGNRVSAGHNALLGQQMMRFQRAANRNSQRISNRNSQRMSGRVASHRSTRLSGRQSKPKMSKEMFTKENGWSKYKNDKTGQVIYYNHKTGQWVDTKDVASSNNEEPSV